MAPSHSFNILSLVLAIAFLPLTWARPWIVTQAYQEVEVTRYDYYDEDPTITTSIQEIRPTASSLPEPLSIITSTDTYYEATIVQNLYPTNVGTPVPYSSYYDEYDDSVYETHFTVYVVNITYTAPTACSSDWTTTTAIAVYPPDGVESLLPTTAMSTSVSVDNSEPFQPTTYTFDYIFVEPTQVPSDTLSYLSSAYYPTTMADSCYYSSNSDSGSDSDSSSSSGTYYGCRYCSSYWGDYEDNWWFDSWYMGISPFALVMILTFGWIGLWLIAGFIEAWVRFRRLMLGWQTRRGLPICWAFTILPVTLLVIIGWKKGFRPRSQADAIELRKQWDSWSFWHKLKLYFIWGFRYKYPTVLGEAPMPVKMKTRPSKKPGDGGKMPRESLLSSPQNMVQVEASGALNGNGVRGGEGLPAGHAEGHDEGHSGSREVGGHSESLSEGHSDGHSEGQPAVRPAGDSDDIGRAQ